MATMDDQKSRLNWVLATLGALAVLVLLNVWMALPAAAQRTAVIATCGTLTQATPALGSAGIIGLDQSGNVCVSASVTASVTGFAPAGTFATLTATGSSASVALPAGAVVVFSNTGTTAVSCTLGIGSATAVASNNVIQSGSWMAMTVGSNTFGACIDQTGSASNVVVLSGGSGLPTGAGGGGSGGGGAVTIADAADVTQGSTADAACATDNGTCTIASLVKRTNQRLTTVNTTLGTPMQATGGTVSGTGTAGTAATGVLTVQGIASMTKLLVTPDANSAVNVAQINGVTPLMGNGVTGTGSSRVTIASDNTAIAGVGAVATGAAPPANAVYLGANASGATGGLVAGLIQCDSTAIYDASTNGSTELKALTSGRSVYVCGYTILGAGTVNVKLIYGTGTACATGSNNMTPAFQLTTQVGAVDGSPFYRGMKTASANALCINTSAGVAVQAVVYYSVL